MLIVCSRELGATNEERRVEQSPVAYSSAISTSEWGGMDPPDLFQAYRSLPNLSSGSSAFSHGCPPPRLGVLLFPASMESTSCHERPLGRGSKEFLSLDRSLDTQQVMEALWLPEAEKSRRLPQALEDSV